jgi:hypothetical protein
MSELDDAVARLERAVARLEAASSGEDGRIAAVAAGIAAHIDAALARLGRLLEPEE